MNINILDIPVFYINMKKDIEKRNHMERLLSEHGFKNFTRIDAVYDSKSGRRGLSKSQYLALTQIEPPFIVMEDDCNPKYFVKAIAVPDDADAVYLGNSAWGMMDSYSGFFLRYKKVEGYGDLYRIFNMLSSHAILYLSKEYTDACRRMTYYCAYTAKDPIPMDVPFAQNQKYYNVYTPNKPLFVQKDFDGKMSNAPAWTDKRLTDYVVNNQKHQHLYFQDPIV